MPDAAWRPCPGAGCFEKVKRGLCSSCATRRDQRRRTARVLTYSESWWRAFRTHYIHLLVEAGVVPACGARLPGGPTPTVSRCLAEGVLTGTSTRGSSLHLHHQPELALWEQSDRAAICDPMRIVVACDRCHNAETSQRERLATGGQRRGFR